MKDGSINKISQDRFARADLEHILLCVDDDMDMKALKQTNYVKSIVTAQGLMDLEQKKKQSFQGWMYCRLLAFSNGDLQSLYDHSDGFYRRQLMITTKGKSENRKDDPDIAEKMRAEKEGIFLWAYEGLQRLVANQFHFSESERIKANRETAKKDNNNLFEFMEATDYICFAEGASVSAKELYNTYRIWCYDNEMSPLKSRSFSDLLIANMARYKLERNNNVVNSEGRRVWGFWGIKVMVKNYNNSFIPISQDTYVPNEWKD